MDDKFFHPDVTPRYVSFNLSYPILDLFFLSREYAGLLRVTG